MRLAATPSRGDRRCGEGRRRLPSSMRRPPALPVPLAVLLGVAAVLAVAWSILLPALQGPDEGDHYSYTEKIVESGALPWTAVAGKVRSKPRPLSTEHDVAGRWSGLEPLLGNPAARPFWTTLDERLWAEQDASLPPAAQGDVDFTTTFRNPPLFYLYEVPAYALGRSAGFFDRTYLMRLANIPMLLGIVALTWLLAGRLLGPQLLPRTVATAVVALQPLLVHLSATINPDPLLTLLGAATLLLAVIVVQDGLTWARGLGLLGVAAAAGLTQPRGLALVAPAWMAILLALHGRQRLGRAPLLAGGAAVLVALGGAVLLAIGPSAFHVRQFGSYVWQFYLPKLPFMNETIGPPDYGIREVAVDRLWGALAQLEIALPEAAATSVWVVTLVLAAATVALAILRRDAVRRQWRVAVVLVTAVAALVVLIHVVAYRAMLDLPSDPVIAGRYLLPLLPLGAVALGWVLAALPRLPRAGTAGLAVSGLLVVHLIDMGTAVERFYG